MKNKILKILSVIVVIILCVSVFCIPVLADDFNDVSNYQVIKIYNDYGNMNFSSSIFSLHDPFPDDSYVCDFITYNIYPAYNAYNIDFDFPDTFSNGQIITVSGAFCLSQYTTSFTINFGSFTNVQLFDSSCKKMYNELDSYTYYYYVPFSYTFEVSNVSLAKLDKIFFNYRGSAPLYSFGISNLSFQSSIDVDGIVSGATNNIINNQNNNASNIQANQDKNTNKIINGGRDNPGYSSVDKSATNDYQAKEEEINNHTANARSSTINFFNNFGGLLNDTPVSGGLLAVSKIMTEFFNIGWLSGLIQFALGLGAFAFILGSVIMVVGKVSSRPPSERSKRK